MVTLVIKLQLFLPSFFSFPLPHTLSLSSSLSPTFLSLSFHLHHDQRLILGGSFIHLVHQFPHNPIKWNIEGGCSLKEKRKMYPLEVVWCN